MARILVTTDLPGGLGPLEGHAVDQRAAMTHGDLVRSVPGARGLLCLLTDRIDAEVIAAAGDLEVIGNIAVGYDNVDVEAATRRGIAVCNTPGVLDETTADLAFALILAASRRLREAEMDLRAGGWSGWAIDQYLGHDVHGATLGLVGYGRIGRAVARRAAGFDMDVLHHCRTATGEAGYVADLHELLARSDIVSLHVPLTDETHHLIGRAELGRMPSHGILVNTARGPVVDEDALVEALEDGTVFAAGLDVHEHEPQVHPGLVDRPDVVLLPHIGSATVATRTAMVRTAAEGVADVLAGRTPAHLVNPQARSR